MKAGTRSDPSEPRETRGSRGSDNQTSRGNYGIGILRSNDGGKTWSKSLDWKPSQQTGVQSLQIVPAPDDPGRFTVWAVTSEGIYRLDTAKAAGTPGTAEDWKLSLNVVAATSVSVNPRNPREVVAGCGNFASQGHPIPKRSTSASATSPSSRSRNPCYIPDVDPFRRSSNCLDNTSWNAPLVLAPSNRNGLYAARDVIYRSDRSPDHVWAAADTKIPEKACISTDAPGITWAPTSLGRDLDGNPVFALAVAPKHDDHLVIATAPRYNRMNVFRSNDAGSTWERITYDLPEKGYPMSIVFDPGDATESKIYLTLGDFGISHLWKLDMTAGAPHQWQDLDGGRLPDVWASSLLIDPADPRSRHLYVATDRGVYRSADGGATWEAWSEGLYPGVLSMELLLYVPDRLLRLVTHGNGIWQRKLPPV